MTSILSYIYSLIFFLAPSIKKSETNDILAMLTHILYLVLYIPFLSIKKARDP